MDGELIVLKFVPTCFDLKCLVSVVLSAWIADKELRIRSMIVVGFSLVTVTVGIFWVVGILSSLVDFLVANFKIADSLVWVSYEEVVFLVTSGTSVVEMAVMELMILSMIETGFSVVLVWDADTLGKKFSVLCEVLLFCQITKGLVRWFSVEEERYSPLTRFAEGTVFTGSSKLITSTPKSLSWYATDDFTCKRFEIKPWGKGRLEHHGPNG